MKNIQVGTLEAFNIENKKDITHKVTNIKIDIIENSVSLTIEKGTQVEKISLSLQEAKNIGFLNFEALKPFCR